MQTETASKDRRAEKVDRLRPLLQQLPGFFWFAGADGSMEYVG